MRKIHNFGKNKRSMKAFSVFIYRAINGDKFIGVDK